MITFDPFGSIYKKAIVEDDDELGDEEIIDANDSVNGDSEDTVEEQSDTITLDNLYSPAFNMQATIATIANLTEEVKIVISEIEKSNTVPSLGDTETFETVCMDAIDCIVKMNRNWTRLDAIQEAAKELVAVRKASQTLMAEMVHMRVLREFQIASDSEYILLRNQLWDE